MEDILWIVALILINAVFGKSKKKKQKNKTFSNPSKSGTLQKSKVSTPKKSIERYFKDIAEEVKRQQEEARKKFEQQSGAKAVKKAETAEKVKQADKKEHVGKISQKEKAKVQREGAYYFKEDNSALESETKKPKVESRKEVQETIPIEGLFEDSQDVVRGIIYSEILSKPKSLRR